MTGSSPDSLIESESTGVEFGFDDAVEMFFALDVASDEKVYVSDRKRLGLYEKGPKHLQ